MYGYTIRVVLLPSGAQTVTDGKMAGGVDLQVNT
jgi:hypothetical protein